jgi:hypothetical protein
LIFPYYVFGIIDFIIYCLALPFTADGRNNMLEQIIYFFLGRRIVDCYAFSGALWFLIALFSDKVIFYYK